MKQAVKKKEAKTKRNSRQKQKAKKKLINKLNKILKSRF